MVKDYNNKKKKTTMQIEIFIKKNKFFEFDIFYFYYK